MLNPRSLLATLGTPMLVFACQGEASRPLEPEGIPSAQTGQDPRVAAAQASHRHDITSFGSATFIGTDPSGCVQSIFDIFGAKERVKDDQRGAPSTTGVAVVLVDQFDQCTGTFSGQIAGDVRSDAVVFTMKGNLSTATLQATIPAIDFSTGAGVEVTLNVTWTGFDEIFPQVDKARLKTPNVLQIFHSKATIREATTVGTASLDGVPLALEPLAPGQIGRAKSGQLVVQFD